MKATCGCVKCGDDTRFPASAVIDDPSTAMPDASLRRRDLDHPYLLVGFSLTWAIANFDLPATISVTLDTSSSKALPFGHGLAGFHTSETLSDNTGNTEAAHPKAHFIEFERHSPVEFGTPAVGHDFSRFAIHNIIEIGLDDAWNPVIRPTQDFLHNGTGPWIKDGAPLRFAANPTSGSAAPADEAADTTGEMVPICGCTGCVGARLHQAAAAMGEQQGHQEYVLNGLRWDIDPLVHQVGSTVTWSIATANYAADYIQFDGFIAGAQFVNVIRAAFDAWEAVTNIDFIESPDSSRNDIRLGWGDLGGPNGTLGIANYSFSSNILIESFIRFDLAENWNYTIGQAPSGTSAYVVALHEIGHTIGIDHSEDSGAVMYAFLNRTLSGLTQDDIDAVQAIYGAPESSSEPPSNTAPQDIELSSSAIVENATSGTVVGSLSTVDPDSGDNHTYEILFAQSESGANNFTIVGDQLRVASGADIDFESDNAIRVAIRATDSGGLSVDRSFTIQVANQSITDIAVLAGGTVVENATSGTSVATFAAYEGGVNEPGAQLILVDDANGLFVLDGNTLRIASDVTADYESAISYTVRIRATDGSGPAREESFTIGISNSAISDIAMQSGGTVAENATNGTTVATFAALEGTTMEATAAFSLVDDADGRFVLDGTTLRLANSANIDFETQTSHTIRIRATDSSGPPREETFTIQVINAPISDITLTSGGSVAEGAATGTEVAVFQAFDNDPEVLAQWTLTDDAGGRFVLEGGTLKVAAGANLDFEQASSHTVVIAATDGNSPAYAESFVISITNSAISDILATSGGTVVENAAAGTPVAVFEALEGGLSTNAVLTLIDDAGGLFVLDGNTLKVAPGASVDYETAVSHMVRLSASDGTGQPFEKVFQIQVANMAISSIALASGGAVDENAIAGTIVATFQASENPVEPSATFSLPNDAGGRFYLDGNQLRVAQHASLDFEAAASHTIEVGATDGTGPLLTQTITIQVNDVSGATIWGTPQSDMLIGTAENDVIRALDSDDRIDGSGGQDLIDGDGGADTVAYGGPRADFERQLLQDDTIQVRKPDGNVDTLIDIERIDLADGDYVFDIDSTNAGFGYRIYQAAFGRIPDEVGVRFWINVLDALDAQGRNQYEKQQYIAAAFNNSDEFQDLYGSNPSDYEYIDAMYRNVLFRLPDQEGYEFWVGSMKAGLTREDILIAFTESDENVINNAANLDDGVWVV